MIAKLSNYLRFIRRINAFLKMVKAIEKQPDTLLPDEVESTVDAFGNKLAFIFEDEEVTFSEFEQQANRVANWALAQDLAPGDAVALVMENSIDYIAIWIGLSKVGVITALINSNLEGTGLAHCINIAGAKAIIAGGDQAEHVEAILPDLIGEPKFWDERGARGSNFASAMESSSDARPDRGHRSCRSGTDPCIYVYTSGTTGLPKAARMSHYRVRRLTRVGIPLAEIVPHDVVYNPLPLYHATGGALGIGPALLHGATVHIRRKFSASEFWEDIAKSNATVFVYIGELCRYLVNAPEHPKERTHNLRVGFGNGLRGDVWQTFVERFQVASMREFYGSTEGNVSFVNTDGKIGTVGQLPRFMDGSMGVAFVKFDVEAEEPIRDTDGFCVKCDVDEVGEVLGEIKGTARSSFEGYEDKVATQKKILTDVFKKGDKWFRTGDLMSRDDYGYVRFVDRIGDTFRWKGENVATNEVADAIAKFPGVELANVYGVEVPHTEGRAGMVALTSSGALDFGELARHLLANLPPYAVPLFVRESQEVDTTGTFKFRKVDAVKAGFDPAAVQEPLWVLDAKQATYTPLTDAKHAAILSGEVRL